LSFYSGNEIWHPRCTDEAIAMEASKQVNAAPEPPIRTASHNTEWNARYQQNGLPDEKPVRVIMLDNTIINIYHHHYHPGKPRGIFFICSFLAPERKSLGM